MYKVSLIERNLFFSSKNWCEEICQYCSNLSRNSLTGPIPDALIAKSKSNSLQLRFAHSTLSYNFISRLINKHLQIILIPFI